MPESSQGTSVSFNGSAIGSLTNWRVVSRTAVVEEVTNVLAQVIGTGVNSRVVKQLDCVAVEPGTLDLTMIEAPPFIMDDIGLRGELAISFESGTVSGDAIFERFEISASVGQFLNGTATFRFTGVQPA